MINREQMDKIIQEVGSAWWDSERFDQEVRSQLPKDLVVLSSPPKQEKNYNCSFYMLGLSENQKVIEDSGGFIYSDFVNKLIAFKSLEQISTPIDGDYIVYRDIITDANLVTHTGIVRGDLIFSKWSWGPLIKHEILDVPESYGSNISYFKKFSSLDAEKYYWKFKSFNVK